MSHSIKISEEAYEELRRIQRRRESYKDTFDRVMRIIRPLEEASAILRAWEFQPGDLSQVSRDMVEFSRVKTGGD